MKFLLEFNKKTTLLFYVVLIFIMSSFISNFSYAKTLISYEQLENSVDSTLPIIKPFKVCHNTEMLYEDIENDHQNFLMVRKGLVFRGVAYPTLDLAMASIQKKMQQGISFSAISRPIVEYEGEYNLGEHQTKMGNDTPWISTTFTFEWANAFSQKLKKEKIIDGVYSVIFLIRADGLPNISIGDFAELPPYSGNMFLAEREIAIYKNIRASNVIGAILYYTPSLLTESIANEDVKEIDKIKVYFNTSATQKEKEQVELLVQSKFNRSEKLNIKHLDNSPLINDKINMLLEQDFDAYDSMIAAQSLSEDHIQLLIHLRKNVYRPNNKVFGQQLIDLIRDLSKEQLGRFKELLDAGFHVYPNELYDIVRHAALNNFSQEQMEEIKINARIE